MIFFLVFGFMLMVVLFARWAQAEEAGKSVCLECGSKKFSLVSKEATGLSFYDVHKRDSTDYHSMPQLRYKVKYKCPDCGAQLVKETYDTRY